MNLKLGLGIIVGALTGLAILRNPLGGLIGAVVGFFIDRWLRSQGWSAQSFFGQRSQQSQNVFTECVVNLAAKLAKVDGQVLREEVDSFKAQFRIPESQMAIIGKLYNEAKKDASGYEVYAQRLAQTFAEAPPLLAAVLDALTNIAVADGAIHPAEREFLDRVAVIFGMASPGFSSSGQRSGGGDPYAMLGVSRTAKTEDIKAAWRKLTREHHPDTLIAKGLSKEYVDMATRKMAEINAAWDQICKERGES